MSCYAERFLKQKVSNTGYGRISQPAPQVQTQSARHVRRSAPPPAEVVPPGEPPSDDSIDLTPDGYIVRRRRPRQSNVSMGELDIDLDIHAPVTNRT